MEALFEPGFDLPLIILGAPPDPREQAYLELRRRLERALFDHLASANLLSSATEETPDPRNPRFLVHPSIYDDQDLSYIQFRRMVIGQGTRLWNVEIFEPNLVPRNVSRLPDWLDDFVMGRLNEDALPERSQPAEAGSIGGFWHDKGYAHVSIRGIEFALNPVQAGIVRILHQAALADRRWVSGEALRQEVGFKYTKVSGVFRHVRSPSWRELIASDGRGAYRLNI